MMMMKCGFKKSRIMGQAGNAGTPLITKKKFAQITSIIAQYSKIFSLQFPLSSSLKVGAYSKVIYSKFSKQWLSTVAHTIDCVCSKISNHGLNHGLLFSLFKFFGWKTF